MGSSEGGTQEDGFIRSVFDRLSAMGISPTLAVGGLVGLIVLLFLLSFIFHTLKRMKRRRNYKRLRKARLEEEAREEAEQKTGGSEKDSEE